MVKMEKRKSFVFFVDWHNVLKNYNMSLRCKVYDAIIQYAASGEVPAKLEGEALMAFNFIREDIDRNNAKYEAICAKRREWAKKGGAPKGNQNAKKKNNLKVDFLPYGNKSTLNENDNENVNDNDNDNENDILLNENSKINNIITTTTKGASAKKNKVEKNENESNGLFSRMQQLDFKEWRGEFLAEFISADFDREQKLIAEFGDTVKAESLAERVLDRWEKEKPVHNTLDNAFEHLYNTMKIEHNIINRKAKRNAISKSNKVGQIENKVSRRSAPSASDFE